METQTFDAIGTESVVVERMDGRIGVRKEHDPESSPVLQTRFDYGPFGVARKVTAADNTVQTIEYDRLGRPTTHTDPSTGTSTTRYNAFGEPIEQLNGAGQKTVTQYDLLGRATRVSSPDGVTTNTWDTAPLGKGRLQRSVARRRRPELHVQRQGTDHLREVGHREHHLPGQRRVRRHRPAGQHHLSRHPGPGVALQGQLHLQAQRLPATGHGRLDECLVLARRWPERGRAADQADLRQSRLRGSDATRPRSACSRQSPRARPVDSSSGI